MSRSQQKQTQRTKTPCSFASLVASCGAPLSAQHYGFMPKELNFILNYDIKYRLGRNTETEED